VALFHDLLLSPPISHKCPQSDSTQTRGLIALSLHIQAEQTVYNNYKISTLQRGLQCVMPVMPGYTCTVEMGVEPTNFSLGSVRLLSKFSSVRLLLKFSSDRVRLVLQFGFGSVSLFWFKNFFLKCKILV